MKDETERNFLEQKPLSPFLSLLIDISREKARESKRERERERKGIKSVG